MKECRLAVPGQVPLLHPPTSTFTPLLPTYGYTRAHYATLLSTVSRPQAESAAPPPDAQWGRIIRNPRVRAKHVLLDVCAGSDIQQLVMTKRKHDREPYRLARKAKLGEIWEPQWGE